MVGNRVITHSGNKYKVVDKILIHEWIPEARNKMNYVLAQEHRYLVVALDETQEVIRLNPKQIKRVL